MTRSDLVRDLARVLQSRPLALALARKVERDNLGETPDTRLTILATLADDVLAGHVPDDPRPEEALGVLRARRPYLSLLSSVEPGEGALAVVYDPETGQRGEVYLPPSFKREPPPGFLPGYLIRYVPELSEGVRALRVLDRLLYGFDPCDLGSASARARLTGYNLNLYRESVRGARSVSLDRVRRAVDEWNANRPAGLPALKWRGSVPIPE